MSLLLWFTLVASTPTNAQTLRYLGPAPAEHVERVVTLAPSLTEMVVALGVKRVLVGVTRFDELPDVQNLPRVGGYLDPSVEAIVALRPHLVLVQPSPGNQKAVEKLAQLQVPVLVLPLDSVASILEAMREVGKVLNRKAEGQALVQKLEDTRQRVRKASAQLPRLRVLLAYDFSPLVVAGPGTFAHELLEDAGAINAYEGREAYGVLPLEKLVAHAPSWVIDASMTSKGLSSVQALLKAQKVRFVKLPSQRLMHPGPGLAEGLLELFALLHPGVPAP